MMTCTEAMERLEEDDQEHNDVDKDVGDDGPPAAALDPAAAALDAHLAGCASCAAEAAAMRALTARARALPRERAPHRDLWPGIVERIARRRGGSVKRAVLVAAAASLLLVAGGLGSRALLPPRPPALADLRAPLAEERQYVDAVAALRRALDQRKGALSAEAAEVVESNLATIDEALREIRQALRDDPGNRQLEQILSSTNQQKVELLEQVLALVERP